MSEKIEIIGHNYANIDITRLEAENLHTKIFMAGFRKGIEEFQKNNDISYKWHFLNDPNDKANETVYLKDDVQIFVKDNSGDNPIYYVTSGWAIEMPNEKNRLFWISNNEPLMGEVIAWTPFAKAPY